MFVFCFQVSNVLSHTIVQKLNGLKYISPLVQSSNPALQNSAIALMGNLSRSSRTGNRNMGECVCVCVIARSGTCL